ncbi:hypothetical protein A2115_00795 [Candidatus Woesebacteria bacterium GWA1_41_8]|uniref:Uncharacterized protein n=1 Tax=Candidatus Woesebacteria bacterium GWA1_41_8 TaxID=1802471 RepID=A0A1F7WIW5_9BACT|nr:MAG: hypothetical protein A2115_00795 [Candidatus Woesebacteria bacterium GWA1_41_8]
MGTTVFRPNDAVRISNGGLRQEMSREDANLLLEVGDTYLLPGRPHAFQVRRDGSSVLVGKSAYGVKPPFRFLREDLDLPSEGQDAKKD